MSFPTQTFSNITDWGNWVNIKIVPNGIRAITGNIGNITENAAIKFIRQSPLNWKVQVLQVTSFKIRWNF